MAGAAYLKQMHDRFGSAGFLAAYHAGPLRYEQHLATGRPLPPETVAYVSALTPLLASEQNESEAFRIRRAIPYREAPVFIEREDGAFAGDQLAHDERPTRESSDRSTIGSSTADAAFGWHRSLVDQWRDNRDERNCILSQGAASS